MDWDKYKSNRWSPDNIGDSIGGRVINVREENGKSGFLPVLTIATADGEVEIWAGQVHLKQRLADLKPEPGDVLNIRLTDLVHTGQASPMKKFDVRKKAPATDTATEEPY